MKIPKSNSEGACIIMKGRIYYVHFILFSLCINYRDMLNTKMHMVDFCCAYASRLSTELRTNDFFTLKSLFMT